MHIHNSEFAPRAVGPYAQAVRTGNLLFCSGQIPLDPETMTITGLTVQEQTARILDNLTAVLRPLDLTLDNVVKTTVFLTDMADFQAMNEVYAKRFGDHTPARSTIAVKALPLGALLEIEAIVETV